MPRNNGDPNCSICHGTGECRNPDGRVYDCSCVKERKIGKT